MNAQQGVALRLAEGLAATAANILRIASATSPEAAQWAFGQWALRERARAKFALADQMLFDRDGLEMASHERVAAYHGSCFPQGECVEDWTCGIGADLIAFARGGPAFGMDIDLVRTGYALHNLQVHGLAEEVEVHTGDAMERTSGDPDFAFCDPSRRSGSKRTLNIAEFAPDPREVASRFRRAALGGMKLSPMLQDRQLEEFGGRLEFVSFGGECREALVWLSAESKTLDLPGSPGGRRFAVHVETREYLPAGQEPITVAQPQALVFEADPAAIRAHCLGELCSRYGLKALADSNGYLTGEQRVTSPWLSSFEVLASHSADMKRTKAELRRLGGGTPVVKSRGAGIDVEKVRKELKGDGEELVLMIYPDGKSLRHILCRRLS